MSDDAKAVSDMREKARQAGCVTDREMLAYAAGRRDALEESERIALDTSMGMQNHPVKIASAIRSLMEPGVRGT